MCWLEGLCSNFFYVSFNCLPFPHAASKTDVDRDDKFAALCSQPAAAHPTAGIKHAHQLLWSPNVWLNISRKIQLTGERACTRGGGAEVP